MRIASTNVAFAAGLLLASASLVSPAFAQAVRSADQITRDLMPTASMLAGPTRGIRPVAPGAVAPSSAAPSSAAPSLAVAPVSAAMPVATSTHASAVIAHAAVTPASNLFVPFPSGSAEISPGAMRSLNELGKALSSPSLAAFRFRIEGHTDTVGSPATNLALSEHRATAVTQYLSNKFGIAASRMDPVGMGAEHLAVKTAEQTPEARNRRVQVVNLGA